MKLTGLNPQQVSESRAKHGENILTPSPKTPIWRLFLEKFNDPVIRILLVAASLSLIISVVDGSYAETIGIFVAILLATGVAFFFEMDAAKKFELLNQINEDIKYKTIRDGAIVEVSKRELVVGDIIILESGEEIPADGVLIESNSLIMNESTLTGEPYIKKSEDPEHNKPEATYPTNTLLRSTTVIEGNAILQINRVGDATEFGKVARQATISSGQATPLSKQLNRLAKLIGVIGFSLATITFIGLLSLDLLNNPISLGQMGLLAGALMGLFMMLTKVWMPIVFDAMEIFGSKKVRGEHLRKTNVIHWVLMGVMTFGVFAIIGLIWHVKFWEASSWISLEYAQNILQYFMVAVTLIVVAVPEGLPMSVTLSLALAMRKMLKNNNLVRKMHASETMGAITIICTDKTGTLTKNQMSVAQMELFSGDNNHLYKAIAINSTANLDREGKPLGNPTEGALLLWLKGNGVDYSALREERVQGGVFMQMPFNSKYKFMATIVEDSQGVKRLFVKGAPEYIIKMCQGVENNRVEELLKDFQSRAMRTLAFAECEIIDMPQEITVEWVSEQRCTFSAITAIADPVRADVPDAIAECIRAGIKVKMITGDTSYTAREIARQIGLWTEEDGSQNEITGVEWELLTDEEAYERADKIKIMSRARPLDKQRLVKMLQKRGEVVAVTGDGTNDAPALNFAHVGLSMGSGTSVAKEASDITLLDDSFSSIASAVMWGRAVYLNIQRFILFQLTINVAALMIVFLGSMLGFELPLTVTQMLWVNLIMDTFAAGALASLPPNKSIMKNRPRGIKDFIITPFMSRAIVSIGFVFVALLIGMLYYMQEPNGTISTYNLTIFFTTFVMLQYWNMFNAKAYRSGHTALHQIFKSPAFLLVGLLILIGQIVIVNFAGEIFRVVPISLIDWLIIAGATSSVLWIGEIGRLFKRN